MLDKKKAQASLEYLSIVALSLAILVPVWLYVDNNTLAVKDELRAGYARQGVYSLRDAADVVFVQGPPAQLMVDVNVPDGVTSAGVAGRHITLWLATTRGNIEVYGVTIANLTGELYFARAPGLHRVLVKAQQNASGVFVNITG